MVLFRSTEAFQLEILLTVGFLEMGEFGQGILVGVKGVQSRLDKSFNLTIPNGQGCLQGSVHIRLFGNVRPRLDDVVRQCFVGFGAFAGTLGWILGWAGHCGG